VSSGEGRQKASKKEKITGNFIFFLILEHYIRALLRGAWGTQTN